MKPEILLDMLHTAEKLKDTTRHCYTSGGRHESVAEHSWRLALMAFSPYLMALREQIRQDSVEKIQQAQADKTSL